MRLRLSIAFGLFLVGAANLYGAEPDTDPCPTALTQADMNQCSFRVAEEAKAELDQVYRALMAKLGKKTRQLLADSQKAWSSYRSKTCAFETSGTTGGSVHPMIVNYCVAHVTKERIARLRSHVKCEEGDLGCVR